MSLAVFITHGTPLYDAASMDAQKSQLIWFKDNGDAMALVAVYSKTD